MQATPFTELVGCRLPIQQAGFGGVATVELAEAVARAGALGMLTLDTPGLDEWLAGGVRRGPGVPAIGVNFLIPMGLDIARVERVASAVRLVEFFWADPDPRLVQRAHAGGALVCWQTGSVDEARAAADAGCDLVVAQGVEAGGHVRGTVPLHQLLAEVVPAVDVPVIAAGGIGSGRAVHDVLAVGAAAARVGTAFVVARESAAHERYVAALVAAHGDDTVLTTAFGRGWPDAPHRVLRGSVDAAEHAADDVVGVVDGPVGRFDVDRWSPYPPSRWTSGAVDAMAQYAGAGVGDVTGAAPAEEIVRRLVAEADAAAHS